MEAFSLKVKVSILWMFMDFALLLLLTLNSLDVGGGLGQMISTFPSQLVPYMLLGGAMVMLIPFVMAFLSLTLSDSSSRRVNILLGLVFTVFNLSGVAYGLSQITIASAYLLLLQTAALMASVLIVWFSLKWSSQKAELIEDGPLEEL